MTDTRRVPQVEYNGRQVATPPKSGAERLVFPLTMIMVCLIILTGLAAAAFVEMGPILRELRAVSQLVDVP